MSRALAAGILVIALGVLGACKERPEPTPASLPTASQTGAGRIDLEDPKAGTNTGRPDAMKDVKPGTP